MNEPNDPLIQPEIDRLESAKLGDLRLRRASPKPDGRNAYEQLKNLVIEKLLAVIESEQEILDSTILRPLLLERIGAYFTEERIVLKSTERRQLIEDVLTEVMSSGSHADVNKSS